MPDTQPPLVIPCPGTGASDTMPTIETVLDQAFANHHTGMMHAGQRLTETIDNIGEQTKLGFLEMKEKVGTREAAAMQRMDADKLANAILQQRSAGRQPVPDADE